MKNISVFIYGNVTNSTCTICDVTRRFFCIENQQ